MNTPSPWSFFFFIKLCLCQERLVTNWLDALDTAACLTGFILLRHWSGCPQTLQAWPWTSDLPFLHLPSTGIAGMHQQSSYIVLETKPRAWSQTRTLATELHPAPALRIFTVSCSISNTIQWFESNSSKNNAKWALEGLLNFMIPSFLTHKVLFSWPCMIYFFSRNITWMAMWLSDRAFV